MPRRDGREPLINCLDVPCPWEATFRSCAYRIAQRGDEGFPKALCAFYSTPGPHAPSKIARVTGLSVEAVNRTLEVVHIKIRERIVASGELHFDPRVRTMVDDHVEGISA